MEERLDRFFSSPEWAANFPNAVALHAQKQSSDHSIIILETSPAGKKIPKRFYFDKRWVDNQEAEEVVRKAWNNRMEGTPMFQVSERIKCCRVALLKWNGKQKSNSSLRIKELKKEMEFLQNQGGFEIGKLGRYCRRIWRINTIKRKSFGNKNPEFSG